MSNGYGYGTCGICGDDIPAAEGQGQGEEATMGDADAKIARERLRKAQEKLAVVGDDLHDMVREAELDADTLTKLDYLGQAVMDAELAIQDVQERMEA